VQREWQAAYAFYLSTPEWQIKREAAMKAGWPRLRIMSQEPRDGSASCSRSEGVHPRLA
jgi:hypothetical protein